MDEYQLNNKIEQLDSVIEEEDKFVPLSLNMLMSKDFGEQEWLVEHLVPKGGITAVSGSPAAFKTWFALELAAMVSKGGILFDKFAASQTGVLFIDEENGERLLQQRLRKLMKVHDLPLFFLSYKNFRLSPKSVSKVIEVVDDNNIGTVIFDSLIRIHGADENDASKMAAVFNMLKEFRKKNITVLFTHHNRKQGFFKGDLAQSMRGSSDILASVDSHLALERKVKDDYITVTQTKNRLEPESKPFKLGIRSEEQSFEFEYLGEVDEAQTKKEDCQELIKDILSEQSEPMYKKQLFDSIKQTGTSIGYSTFKNAVIEMLKNKSLFERKGEGNKTFCSLSPVGDEPEEPTVGQNSFSTIGEEF